MSNKRQLLGRLAAADRSLQEVRLPPAGVRRVATRISEELSRPGKQRRFGWMPMATFVAGAALVLLFLLVARFRPTETSPVATRATAVRVIVTGDGCEQRRGEVLELVGACNLVTQSPSMRVETATGTRLSLADRVLEVHDGSAMFDVDAVAGSPVRVQTPGGEIVVVGTRFRVAVAGATGSVELYEGRLEFHDLDGRVTQFGAGQRLTFGGSVTLAAIASGSGEPDKHAAATPVAVPEPMPEPEPKTEAVPEPKAVASPRSAKSAPRGVVPSARRVVPAVPRRDAGAVVEATRELRRVGDYLGAAKRLEDALNETWPPHTAEVLSNELGRIVARHLSQPDRACKHWRGHLKRFPKTRFRTQIEASMVSLECP